MPTIRVDTLKPHLQRKLSYFFLMLTLVTAIAIAFVSYRQLQAQAGANCSGQYFIDQLLPTGARWQMCWEARQREGIVLYDVYYTPVGNATRQVLAQANLAQIHVPYDDNGARYHDSTDSGLGGSYLTDLTAFDCPDGVLLQNAGRSVVCMQIQSRGYAYKYTTSGLDRGLQGYQLRIFSISHVGEYNYIAQWDFSDDGAIKPQVGATGKLQRLGTYVLPENGWPLRTEAGMVVRGVSHTHNYYWRLDFDIGDKANDLVEEINFLPTNLNQERVISVTQFPTEAARSRDAQLMRSWRIRDKAITNADGHYISYDLIPASGAVHYIGPDYEPFTYNDFYVTAYNPCEKFTSHNPLPCQANVSDFVNGENTNGADLVLWYGVNFHHLVRDEDEDFMPAHWDGFTLSPRDWTATNPLDAVSAPPSTPSTPTLTPVATNTAVVPTATRTPTATNTPAGAPTATRTPVPNNTATSTPTATRTATPISTATATSTPVAGNGTCTVYTSTNVPAPLPNGSFNTTSLLTVPNAVTISDVNVNVDMSHTYIGDLTFILTQQSTNKSVTIIDRPGNPASGFGCRFDNIVATLGDEAALPVEDQCNQTVPAINGSFKPNNPLSLFDGGQSNGTWALKVIDNDPYSDAGTLNAWSLQICAGGEAPSGAALSDTALQLVAANQAPDEPEKVEMLNKVFLPGISR